MSRVRVPQPEDRRIHLDLPFAEKDTAKALGARFDGATKRWWIDERWPDRARFARWLPASVAVAEPATFHTCPGCGTRIADHVELCTACRVVHPVVRRRRRRDPADRFLARVSRTGLVLTARDTE